MSSGFPGRPDPALFFPGVTVSQTSRSRFTLLLALCLGPSLAVAGLPEITVDCSKGENLQRALDHIQDLGFGRVHVLGTCIGSYDVLGNGSIEIVGESKETSGIQAGAGAAITAANPGHLEIHNMRLAGALGLHAAGPHRVVFVVGCEIDAVGRGVWADSGAGVLVEQSAVSGEVDSAIGAFGSEVVVEGGTLHDSTYGIYASRSALWLDGVSVTGNSIGSVAVDWATIEIAGGQFTSNSSSHWHVERGSRLTSYNARLGAPGDSATLSIQAGRGASVAIFHDDPLAEIWGSALFYDDSFGALEGTTLHGSVHLDGFSRLRLDGVVQGGSVDCDSASDAWCGPAASAQTDGCSSAPTTCSPRLGDPGGAGSTRHAPRPGPPRGHDLPKPTWMLQGEAGRRGQPRRASVVEAAD
jgi:hypothetical protein